MGLKSGANNIKKIYVGTTHVKAVYQGSNLVWGDEGLDLWRYSNTEIEGKTLLYEYLGENPKKMYGFGGYLYLGSEAIMSLGLNFAIDTQIPYVGQRVYVPEYKRSEPYYNYVIEEVVNSDFFVTNYVRAGYRTAGVRNSALDYYAVDYPVSMNVPKCGGKSVIGADGTYQNSPFYERETVEEVNLQNVPFQNNNMSSAFDMCSNLKNVYGINKDVTQFGRAFSACRNLKQNIKIPNNVVNMRQSFYSCPNLNQGIRIPSSVTSLDSTFCSCRNLDRNFYIPKNVTNMYWAFYLTDMQSSWVNIASTNVSDFSVAFNRRHSASGTNAPVNIFFIYKHVNNTNTTTFNSLNKAWGNDKNFSGEGKVIGADDGTNGTNKIRLWDDGANYINRTYNSTHCILGKWHGNLDTFLNKNVAWTTPVVPEKLFLSNIPTAINRSCFSGNTKITSVDFGSEIPWSGNLMGSGSNANNRKGGFKTCKGLEHVQGVVNSSVISATSLFDNCVNLTSCDVIFPDNTTNFYVTYAWTNCSDYPPLSPGATNLQSMFWGATSLTRCPVIPPKVTRMVTTFSNGGQTSLFGNMYILSPVVGNIENMVRGWDEWLKKDVYIYYTYSNGVNTSTYNQFKKYKVFTADTGNGAGVDPMYNITSWFYIHNLSNTYNNLWSWSLGSTAQRQRLIRYKGNDPHVAVMTQYPDYEVDGININCFNNCRYIRTLALYNEPIWSNYGNTTSNLFRDCYNLRVVQGLYTNVGLDRSGITAWLTDMSNTYVNCYSLRVACPVGPNVTNISYIYDNCRNLNFNCQLGPNTLNLQGAFRNCVNLDRPIEIPETATDISRMFQYCYNLKKDFKIPNNVTNMYATFYGCSKLSNEVEIFAKEVINAVDCFSASSSAKTVYIPFYYDNGVYTKTFNAFYSAGYIYSNGDSTGRNGTTFYDLTL